jgi:hypothetical protein
MTKFTCKDPSIIYSIIKANPNLILAASDYHIIFKDNVDITQLINKYNQLTEITIEENYTWIRNY